MLFLLLPFISIAVFALFGQRYKGRGTIKEYRKSDSFKLEKRKMLPGKNIEEQMLNAQSNISGRGIYSVDAKVYSNGDEGYDSLFADLEKAKEFIHLQYYIIKPGEIFDKLKSILLRKAKEGVEVRFIVDDFGR